jgi:hypothetical protein
VHLAEVGTTVVAGACDARAADGGPDLTQAAEDARAAAGRLRSSARATVSL